GFYAPRDHIVVFSNQRLDSAFSIFSRLVQPYWQQGLDRASVLDGTAKRKPSQTPDDFARMQTMALLEKALEEEAERASVSHDGTRQLLVASGLLPRAVVTPQWVTFGMAAFFETPKG